MYSIESHEYILEIFHAFTFISQHNICHFFFIFHLKDNTVFGSKAIFMCIKSFSCYEVREIHGREIRDDYGVRACL